MMRIAGRRGVVVVAAVVALVLVAGVLATRAVGWWGTDRTAFQEAVRLAPPTTVRFSWTDWSAAKAEVGAKVGPESSTAAVQSFVDRAYERDLTSRSALVDTLPVLNEQFGWSPAALRWELLAQAPEGQVDLLALDDDVDLGDLRGRLEDRGYRESKDGVWVGGPEVLAAVGQRQGQDVTPILQHFAFDDDRHLLLASDTSTFLAKALASLRDGEHDTTVDDVMGAVGAPEPAAAAVYAGSYVCEELAMGQADEEDQAQAKELIAEAGPISPLTGFALVLRRDGDLAVGMSFEKDEQARTNARTRARLAAGDAPGQGGTFPDRFRLGRVEATGNVVTMALRPRKDAYVLSDLADGPVLFATC